MGGYARLLSVSLSTSLSLYICRILSDSYINCLFLLFLCYCPLEYKDIRIFSSWKFLLLLKVLTSYWRWYNFYCVKHYPFWSLCKALPTSSPTSKSLSLMTLAKGNWPFEPQNISAAYVVEKILSFLLCKMGGGEAWSNDITYLSCL